MIEATRYKNGSIHVKGTPDTELRESTLIQILWALEDKDCYMIGEAYCVSNYDMGVTLHSAYNGMCYDIIMGEAERTIEEGHTLIIKPRAMTEEEAQWCDEWDNPYDEYTPNYEEEIA